MMFADELTKIASGSSMRVGDTIPGRSANMRNNTALRTHLRRRMARGVALLNADMDAADMDAWKNVDDRDECVTRIIDGR